MREEIAGLFSYTVFLFWHLFHNSFFEMLYNRLIDNIILWIKI
nr:MAG TPA: hypothetical protein [Caudoviricetes sp.]